MVGFSYFPLTSSLKIINYTLTIEEQKFWSGHGFAKEFKITRTIKTNSLIDFNEIKISALEISAFYCVTNSFV